MFEAIRDWIEGGGLRRLVTSSVLAVFVAAAGAAKADLVRDFLEIESGYIPHLLSKETPMPGRINFAVQTNGTHGISVVVHHEGGRGFVEYAYPEAFLNDDYFERNQYQVESPNDVITVAFCWKYPSLQSYGYVRYGWFTVQRLANEIVVVSAEMEDRANALKLPLKFPGPAASGWTPPVPPVDYQRVYEDRYEEEWQDDCGQDWIDAIEIHGTTNVTFTGSSSTGWVRTDYNECYRRVETRHEGDSIYDYTFAFETNGTEKIEYWDTICPRHIKCEGWWSFHNAFGDDLEGNEQSESYYDKSGKFKDSKRQIWREGSLVGLGLPIYETTYTFRNYDDKGNMTCEGGDSELQFADGTQVCSYYRHEVAYTQEGYVEKDEWDSREIRSGALNPSEKYTRIITEYTYGDHGVTRKTVENSEADEEVERWWRQTFEYNKDGAVRDVYVVSGMCLPGGRHKSEAFAYPTNGPLLISAASFEEVLLKVSFDCSCSIERGGVTEQEANEYRSYFTPSIKNVGENLWSVSYDVDDKAVKLDESMADLADCLAEVAAGQAKTVTISSKPGLWYAIAYVRNLSEPWSIDTCLQALGPTVELPVPQGDTNLFMRIAVGMKSVSSGDLND